MVFDLEVDLLKDWRIFKSWKNTHDDHPFCELNAKDWEGSRSCPTLADNSLARCMEDTRHRLLSRKQRISLEPTGSSASCSCWFLNSFPIAVWTEDITVGLKETQIYSLKSSGMWTPKAVFVGSSHGVARTVFPLRIQWRIHLLAVSSSWRPLNFPAPGASHCDLCFSFMSLSLTSRPPPPDGPRIGYTGHFSFSCAPFTLHNTPIAFIHSWFYVFVSSFLPYRKPSKIRKLDLFPLCAKKPRFMFCRSEPCI